MGMQPRTEKDIHVVLVDPEPVRRTGFRTVLTKIPQVTRTVEVTTHADVPPAVSRHQLTSGIILLATDSPFAADLQAVGVLCRSCPRHEVVLLRELAGRHEADLLLSCGVRGSIGPVVDEDTLASAVLIIAAGGTVFFPSLSKDADDTGTIHSRIGPEPAAVGLTDREQNVLSLLGKGMANRGIADNLSLSENTVKKYVSEVLRKTGQPDRFRAALYAHRHGI
ncbi:LuxR C-terminal-related transcriptional regulator [Actinosynnema sp. CS-041913]|uniref:helix-turn-helix transcriptional regulator n=1 Tax=Actinosynnema sp. CS-041913 TaxID=3239917 RepID=UPI003D90986B